MIIVRRLSDNTKEYFDRYYAIVDEMSKLMHEVQISDSISEMFILQMIPHHNGAIQMSENILEYTTDTQVEQLAKDIIEMQSKEINMMQEMLNDAKMTKNCERDVNLYQREFLNILDTMVKKMNNISTTNNLNADFLSGMIPHHEAAINMSKNLLKYDITPKLKALAENIVTTQSAQLQQMITLLRRFT